MNKILLETINIKKTYEHINGNITLFNNLSLKIKHGDLIALVGPSGSGKSSLLHLFALLDNPSTGKILINNKETILFHNKKFLTKNTHGTGCTLSSAIATYLSRGKVLKKACELGIKYVNQAIGSNLNYGKGNGPINHLNSIIINKKFK